MLRPETEYSRTKDLPELYVPNLPPKRKHRQNIASLNYISTSSLTRLFALVCLAVPLLYWPPAFDAAGVPREMLLAMSAGLGICLFAIGSLRSTITVNWHPVQLLMVALLIWAGASLGWSVDRGSSILAITQLASLIVLALIASQLSIQNTMEYIIPLTLLAASLVGLIAIGQNFGFNPLALRQLAPPASTFENRNYAANYFDLITPIAFVYLISRKEPGKPRTLLATTALTFSLGFQVISQSRGSWLGLLIASIALAFVCMKPSEFRNQFLSAIRRHKYSLVISFIFVVIVSALPSHVLHSKINEMLSASPDMSTHWRLVFYENALHGFFSRPWTGVGYGAFIMGFAPYLDAVHPITIVDQNSIIEYLHSDPLQMFFELGLPGGILALVTYCLLVVMAWRVIRSKAGTSQRFLALGLFLALLASGTHAWVDFPLRLPTSAYFFWLWSGIIVSLYLTVFPGKNFKSRPAIRLMTGIIGVCFTCYSTFLYTGYLKANREIRSAMLHALHHDCPAVYKLSNRAMNEFGLDHLTRFWYAKVYTYCNAPAKTKFRAMNRVLALDPNMPLPYLTRARLELAGGRLETAATDFNAYRKLLPHRPEGYVGLAQISLKLNHHSQARYWLELALKHSPSNPEIKHLVEQLNAK